jgi:chromosome segregation ATPase
MPVEFAHAENFQRHENRTITFDPRLTTFIGQTDAGKSSMLRLLRWVALNTPDGDAFIRIGSKGAIGTVRIDGHEIRRVRMANGTNEYYLDGEKFVAFGTGVPQKIQDVLKLSRLNFVGQKEPDYWFSQSPSEVSRQLNAIVDLGVIDETNENIGKIIWQCQEAVRTSMARLKDSKEKRDALAWVDAADQQLKAVEQVEIDRQRISENRQKLKLAVDGLQSTIARRGECKALWTAIAVVGRAYVAWQKVVVRRSEIAGALAAIADTLEQRQFASVDIGPLSDAKTRYDAVVAKRAQLARLVDGIRRDGDAVLCGIGIEDQFGFVREFYALADDCGRRVKSLRCLVDRLRCCKDDIDRLKKTRDAVQQELADGTEGRCPVCGNELENSIGAVGKSFKGIGVR